MHALIGGSKTFIATLGERYLRWTDDLRMLRKTWSDNPNGAWLEPIIDKTVSA
jgi:hypothetical protein